MVERRRRRKREKTEIGLDSWKKKQIGGREVDGKHAKKRVFPIFNTVVLLYYILMAIENTVLYPAA